MSTVITLPVVTASRIEALREPVARATRSLCTQYWRRQVLAQAPGHRLDALDVFDVSIMQSLAVIKEHLLHDAVEPSALEQSVAEVESEIKQPDVTCFALTCLSALLLQLGRANQAELWPACADRFKVFSTEVVDGLRFCFNAAVGDALAQELQRQNSALRQPGAIGLAFRLGIARPAVSDGFAQIAASLAKDAPGGLAALCAWRCTGVGSEQQALSSLDAGGNAEAALYALELMNSKRGLAAARAQMARGYSPAALALCAVKAPQETQAALASGQWRDALGFDGACYAWALLGDWPALLDHAQTLDWDDETACRALADGVALVTGVYADGLYDMSQPPQARQARLAELAQSLNLPQGQSVRMGLSRAQVLLESSAPTVGAPLRQMLYVEYACRVRAFVYLDATDLSSVQALGLLAATPWERLLLPKKKDQRA